MSKDYDISITEDGDNDIVTIEITQAQYDQYALEAEEMGISVVEYIRMAMEHNSIAEEYGLREEDFDEE